MKIITGFDSIKVDIDDDGILSIRQQDTCTGEEDAILIPSILVDFLISAIADVMDESASQKNFVAQKKY